VDLRIVQTADDSYTLLVPGMDETYHSRNGALAESQQVFIEAGLFYTALTQKQIRILEVGLGTGLNCLLTYQAALTNAIQVRYHALEPARPNASLVMQLNYAQPGTQDEHFLQQLHHTPNELPFSPHPGFEITISNSRVETFESSLPFDLVYFDAFAPSKVPEQWTVDVFKRIAGMMNPGGVLVTYSSKGEVRRAMHAAGLVVTKLPGPAGKREMVRAIKPEVQI
jgi:tRNA U34 5-methylaminomethyl-2-thiouridine-forming methyltransferase MnmC